MKTEQWSDASQFHETECAGSEQLYGEFGLRVPDRLSIAERMSERWRGSDRLALAAARRVALTDGTPLLTWTGQPTG